MSRLEALRKSLLDMTDDEKLARIRAIRSERRIPHNPAKNKREKVARVRNTNKLATDLAALDPAALKALMESLA